jgi:hypothetical protein
MHPMHTLPALRPQHMQVGPGTVCRRAVQTTEFQQRYTELVQMDSTASGNPWPDHRSNPDFPPSVHSTPREGSAISGLAPLPGNLADLPLDPLLSSRASEPARLSYRESTVLDSNFDRIFTTTESRGGGIHDLLRTPISRGKPQARRQCRKLQVAHWMARSVTAVLYVDPVVAHEDRHGSNADPPAGTVWWWSGGYMHIHDIQANTTSSRNPPVDKLQPKSIVKRLVLDCNKYFVWAGHDTGCAPAAAHHHCGASPLLRITTAAHHHCGAAPLLRITTAAHCHRLFACAAVAVWAMCSKCGARVLHERCAASCTACSNLCECAG